MQGNVLTTDLLLLVHYYVPSAAAGPSELGQLPWDQQGHVILWGHLLPREHASQEGLSYLCGHRQLQDLC